MRAKEMFANLGFKQEIIKDNDRFLIRYKNDALITYIINFIVESDVDSVEKSVEIIPRLRNGKVIPFVRLSPGILEAINKQLEEMK